MIAGKINQVSPFGVPPPRAVVETKTRRGLFLSLSARARALTRAFAGRSDGREVRSLLSSLRRTSSVEDRAPKRRSFFFAVRISPFDPLHVGWCTADSTTVRLKILAVRARKARSPPGTGRERSVARSGDGTRTKRRRRALRGRDDDGAPEGPVGRGPKSVDREGPSGTPPREGPLWDPPSSRPLSTSPYIPSRP